MLNYGAHLPLKKKYLRMLECKAGELRVTIPTISTSGPLIQFTSTILQLFTFYLLKLMYSHLLHVYSKKSSGKFRDESLRYHALQLVISQEFGNYDYNFGNDDGFEVISDQSHRLGDSTSALTSDISMISPHHRASIETTNAKVVGVNARSLHARAFG